MNHEDTGRNDRVGPVLEAGEIAEAVIAAIRSLNSDVLVEDRGSYLRVLGPSPCMVTRAAIEQALGRPFLLPSDLERIMLSFKGTFNMTAERAEWVWKRAS